MKIFSRLQSRTALMWWLALAALPVSVMRGDVVFAWNEAMLRYASTAGERLPPYLEARAFAMAHLAMEAGIHAVSARNDSAGTPAGPRSAAVCAAHDVLVTLLPGGAKLFDALEESHLRAIVDGPDKTRGVSAGRAAAARVLADRAADGWVEIAEASPPMGPVPDRSEGTAAALARGEPGSPSPWAHAKPFVLKSAGQFPVSEMQTLHHDGSLFVDAALRHSKLFDAVDRTAAFESAERSWAQRPVVTWNRIARQLSVNRVSQLEGHARLLASLNVTLAEAALATMHWRHVVGSWRATTTDMWEAIHPSAARSNDILARVDDGAGYDFVRREFRRVLIPPVASYPSLSAAVAGAAQAALARFFKSDEIAFTLPVVRTPADAEASPRSFTTITAAARECAFLATLDGSHTREASIAGYHLGNAIGKYVSKRPSPIR